jgi:hypothetical protein
MGAARNRVSSVLKLSFPAAPPEETRFLVTCQKPGFFCTQAEFSGCSTRRNPVSCHRFARNRVSSALKLSFPAAPPEETRFLVTLLFLYKEPLNNL